jgi:hypothetical protein
VVLFCCLLGLSELTYAQAYSKQAPAKPIVLYTDILSGPNEGGENNKGVYLSVFGKNFGADGLGKRTKVYIGDVEVDNYRYLGAAKALLPGLRQITVQIGSLGNPVRGIPLPIKVVVDGLASNADQTFTVNPGNIYFVSNDGSDFRGDGTYANPYRTVQTEAVNNNGAMGCPASVGEQSIAAVGVWGRVGPGDFIVLRGGTWVEASRDGFFLRVQNKSGTAPRGTVGTGPITIMGYPGEVAFVDRTNATGESRFGGGIASADNARQRLGCGAWVTVANLKIESGFNDGPINVQKGSLNSAGSNWRIVNNELTAKSCRLTSKCRAGGIAGGGKENYWVGNFIHDVYDKPDGFTDFENHGVYVGEDGSYDIAYNLIEAIEGGNGVQTHGGSSTDISNVRIHHNLIRNVGKHGVNIAEGSAQGILIYQNVVYGSGVAAARLNSPKLYGAQIINNTFVDSDRRDWGGSRAALMNDAPLLANAVEIRNNIVVPKGSSRGYMGGEVGFRAVESTVSRNLWFDGKGCGALMALMGKGCVVGKDSLARDPKFISIAHGSEDFRLAADSPARGAGEYVLVNWGRALVRSASFEKISPERVDLGAYELLQ